VSDGNTSTSVVYGRLQAASGRSGGFDWRKWREIKDATEGESWDAQMEAEREFRACQMAVAKVTPRDQKDLMLKAALAVVYDKVKHASSGDVAIISYSVALELINLRMPA